MIKFNINNNNNNSILEVNEDLTLLQFKEKIINHFSLNCDYIDINFIIERPIRKLGKFTLENGIISRAFDIYQLSRYDLNNREINCTFHKVNNYKINKENKENIDISYDLKSEEDFPSL